MERDGALGKEHKLEVRDPDPLKNCAGSLYYLRWMIFFFLYHLKDLSINCSSLGSISHRYPFVIAREKKSGRI